MSTRLRLSRLTKIVLSVMSETILMLSRLTKMSVMSDRQFCKINESDKNNN